MKIYQSLIFIVFFIFIFLFFTFNLNAQVSRGNVQESLSFESKILNKTVRYTIYLPFDYQSSNRYYPVVYLLHGLSDNETGWIQFGEANLILDEAIARRKIPPMILVMPDAGVSRYINNYDRSIRYEDFFIEEFIPYIEKNYRIRAEKRYRGVAGLSMGGYGSLVYALKHPNLFAATAVFSSGIYTEEEIINFSDEKWQKTLSLVYGNNLKGKERITAHFLANDPFHIVQTTELEKLKSVNLYIDCGDDDFLYKGNSLFHILLRDLEIPHEYRVRDGGHTWSYWRSGLVDGLEFIGVSFHQP